MKFAEQILKTMLVRREGKQGNELDWLGITTMVAIIICRRRHRRHHCRLLRRRRWQTASGS